MTRGEDRMKLKSSFIFQDLGDETVIVPVDEAAEALRGMMRVNATGAVIVRGFADGLDEAAIAAQLVERFDGVDTDRALKAVRDTAQKLRAAGLMDQ